MLRKEKAQPGQFRLIHTFSIEQNADRLTRHMAKLRKKCTNQAIKQILKLRAIKARRVIQ